MFIQSTHIYWELFMYMCFPSDSDGKESAFSARDLGLITGWGRSPGEGNGYPLQYSCLEKSMGQRSLVGYRPWGCKEPDMTEWLTLTITYMSMTMVNVRNIDKNKTGKFSALKLSKLCILRIDPICSRCITISTRCLTWYDAALLRNFASTFLSGTRFCCSGTRSNLTALQVLSKQTGTKYSVSLHSLKSFKSTINLAFFLWVLNISC